MAYDGWVEFDGTELVNISRTVQLARALNIPSVWVRPSEVAWIETTVGGGPYVDITSAPWYDPAYPASTEFAGVLPMSFAGLDDSTTEASPVEYITKGGSTGLPRSGTLAIVADARIIASTQRGAEYGKRWLDKVLAGRVNTGRVFCSGADLRYFRYGSAGAPIVNRRRVATTRGASITSKRVAYCNVVWSTTFTLTAGDPTEYGEEVPKITEMGADSGAVGPGVLSSGVLVVTEQGCPAYDYSPIYDPLNPALVPGPPVPDFLPAGWDITPGDDFKRLWARLSAVEPSGLPSVPLIRLTSTVDARMVRVSVWDADADTDAQCGPVFSVVVSYLPAGVEFYIDGEQQAAYVWDGLSPAVRRADSLIYSPDARPVRWSSVEIETNSMVTLDLFETTPDNYQGAGTLRAEVGFIPCSP